ncbi:MAG: hypothetical protein ACREJC_08770 [Tepidisphaeraceae bacterium]
MKTHRLLSCVVATLLFTGCTKTIQVAVPPKVDLSRYQSIGLVAFSSNGSSDLERLSTQKFLQAVQSAQPGTRVVELGTEGQVLASVDRGSWNAATFRAIKKKHEIDAIILGRLDVEKAKPDVRLSTLWKAVSVRADVNATLSAKLIETGTGATTWTDSSQITENVAHAQFNNQGQGQFGARDPEAAYGKMIGGLACAITDDFRVHYVTRRVSKSDLQTASAGGEHSP